MLKTMWRDNWRTIRYSLSRSLSIAMMIFLGVAFFVGLKTAGPSIIKTGQSLVEANHLSDGIIRYPLGLDQDTLEDIEERTNLKVEGIKSTDTSASHLNQTIRVYATEYDKNSFFKVVEGTLPQNSFEIALDQQLLENNPELAIGQYLSLTDLEALNEEDDFELDLPQIEKGDYQIVGFVESSLYLSNIDRGMQFDGQGTVSGYGVILEENMTGDLYREGFYWSSQLEDDKAFSDDYDTKAQRITEDIDSQLDELSNEKLEDMQRPKLKELQEKEEELKAAYDAKKIPQKEFEEKKEELAKAKKEIEAIEPLSFRIIPREDFSGYRLLKNNASKMEELSNLFPVFFFVLAMVVTYITMTRMAQEEQKYIGTMKQMGYTNGHIMQKFIIYSLLSVGLGIALGVFVGTKVLPTVVLSAYETLHPLTDPVIVLNWEMITLLCLGTLFIGLIPAILTPLILIRRSPLELLQENNDINLTMVKKEKTSKTSKVNYQLLWIGRSIKSSLTRSFIMVFALTTATMLLIAGFGLVDSLNGTVARQFDDITHYTSIVYVDSNKADELDQDEFKHFDSLQFSYPVHLDQAEVGEGTNQGLDFQLIVPLGEKDEFTQAMTLMNELGEKVSLEDHGILATPVLAEDGSDITYLLENETYRATYQEVAQNYVGNYLFMSFDAYERVQNKTPEKNAFLVKYDLNDKEEIEKDLLSLEGVQTIFNLGQMRETAEVSMESLNMITVILIIAAAGLTFIILYNLMNIMLHENYRELATLKALGLFDHQVSRLVVAETIILSILGVIVGVFLGEKLNYYVITLLSRDDLLFYPQIHSASYYYSIGLAYLFILVVSIIIHLQIKKVDKVEAMKDTD